MVYGMSKVSMKDIEAVIYYRVYIMNFDVGSVDRSSKRLSFWVPNFDIDNTISQMITRYI